MQERLGRSISRLVGRYVITFNGLTAITTIIDVTTTIVITTIIIVVSVISGPITGIVLAYLKYYILSSLVIK